ncbi:MAG: hypothetical protein V3V20_11395 [Algisphaera sp.]
MLIVSSQAAAQTSSLDRIDRELGLGGLGDVYDDDMESDDTQSYVSFTYGYASAGDSSLESVDGLSISAVLNTKIEFDNSSYFLGAVGTNVGQAARIEFEIGHRSVDINSAFAAGVPNLLGSGDVDLLSLMGNVYLDFLSFYIK